MTAQTEFFLRMSGIKKNFPFVKKRKSVDIDPNSPEVPPQVERKGGELCCVLYLLLLLLTWFLLQP